MPSGKVQLIRLLPLRYVTVLLYQPTIVYSRKNLVYHYSFNTRMHSVRCPAVLLTQYQAPRGWIRTSAIQINIPPVASFQSVCFPNLTQMEVKAVCDQSCLGFQRERSYHTRAPKRVWFSNRYNLNKTFVLFVLMKMFFKTYNKARKQTTVRHCCFLPRTY